MDITPLFKASVKTVRTRIKALGQPTPTPAGAGAGNLLSRPVRDSKFQARAREAAQGAAKLHEFLAENRRAYLDAGGRLCGAERLSRTEREQVDATAQLIIKNCHQLVRELRREADAAAAEGQAAQHRRALLAGIDAHLKRVCAVYDDMKQLHAKRQHELHKVGKLEADAPAWNQPAAAASRTSQQVPYNADLEAESEAEPSAGGGSFSVEEMQLFETENAQLFNELNNLTEEVRQVEGRVVKIAQLQQTLTEKVLEQERDVERIAVTAVGVTENIREGNEQVRQAMQNNSGFRIALIFFILVLSFSLLFLDWYNE